MKELWDISSPLQGRGETSGRIPMLPICSARCQRKWGHDKKSSTPFASGQCLPASSPQNTANFSAQKHKGAAAASEPRCVAFPSLS